MHALLDRSRLQNAGGGAPSRHTSHLALWRLGCQKPDEGDGPLLNPLSALAGDIHCALKLLKLPAPDQPLPGVAPLPVLPAGAVWVLCLSILLPVPQSGLRKFLHAC